MALNKDWKDRPFGPNVGETLADYEARLAAYAAANPALVTPLTAAAMEDLETRAAAEVMAATQVVVPFSYPGDLAVGTGKAKFRVPFDADVVGMSATLGTAPGAGSSVIIDVNKNGTSLFTTQANRPTFAPGATVSTLTLPDVVHFAPGDLMSVDIDSIGGSAVPGADLTVIPYLRKVAPPAPVNATGVSLASGARPSTPSSAGLETVGLDVVAKLTMVDWAVSGVSQMIAAKWTDGLSGWIIYIGPNGNLNLAIAPQAANFSAVSTSATLGLADGATKWIRTTRNTTAVNFYTSDDGVDWTLFESPTGLDAHAINQISSVPVTIGADSLGQNPMNGTVRRLKISEFGGALRGDFDPTQVVRSGAQNPTSYTDVQGNVWSMLGANWAWTTT